MPSMTSRTQAPAAPALGTAHPSLPGDPSGDLTAAQAKVLALLCKPLAVDKVCDVSTWSRQQVVKLAERHGLRIGHAGMARHPGGPAALAAVEAVATRAAYALTSPAPTSSPAPSSPARPRTAETDGFTTDSTTDGVAGRGNREDGNKDDKTREPGDRVERLRTALIDDLLAAAVDYEDVPRIASAAAKVDAAVTVLRERLIAAEQARAQDEADATARAQAAAQVDKLRAELAAAEEQARNLGVKVSRRARNAAGNGGADGPGAGKRPSGSKPRGTDRRFWPGTDYTPRAVRQWARANGMADLVPAVGAFLPDQVVEAALAAGHAHQIAGNVSAAAGAGAETEPAPAASGSGLGGAR